MPDECRAWLEESLRALGEFDPGCLEEVARLWAACLSSGGTVFFCGNGGSAADSQHLAAELVGRFLSDRPAYRAASLSDSISAITAVANDYSFERVFSRQIEALGRPGDVLVAISTSGSSTNVLEAVKAARAAGMRTVAMTGGRGASFAESCDLSVIAPATTSGIVQQVLMAAGHALCARVEAILTGGR
jgi:D-sedoheptulose 7-phosphate isomerase